MKCTLYLQSLCSEKKKVLSDLEGITTQGLEYPLHDETLFFGESRGNSNVVTDDTCIIEVRSGMGIVIINNGD